MRSKLALSFLALSSLVLMPAASFANAKNAAQNEDRHERSSDKVRKVTGCLQKEGDEYRLVADNGDTWKLKGDSAGLADHIGETVRVTGTVNHEKMHHAKQATKDTMESNATEHGDLTVTNVKKVSGSCSK
jgi:uncharacterized protein DUF5818